MNSTRKIQPSSSSTDPIENKELNMKTASLYRFARRLRTTYQRVALAWHGAQIGNQNHYSIERMLAFRDYRESTSPTRAFVYCLLTPAPSIVAMFLIECIPLRSPEEGWKANYTLWIRVLLASLCVTGGIVFLAKNNIEKGAISTARAIRVIIASSICYTGTAMLLAATWKFPIPFGMVLMVFPYVTVTMTLFLMSIDLRALKTNRRLQKQLFGHIISSSAQSLLVAAYPTFNAIFLQLSGVHQAIFMLVLPVIKFFAKQITARASAHAQDCIGAGVVFSVDVFNVLYVSICMQTARSPLTTGIVMSFDILHIVFVLRAIYYHTTEHHLDTEAYGWSSRHHLAFFDRMLAKLKSLDELKSRSTPYSGPIRLFTPIPLPLSAPSRSFLEEINNKRHFPGESKTTSVGRAGRIALSLTSRYLGLVNHLSSRQIERPAQLSNGKSESAASPTETVSKPNVNQVMPASFNTVSVPVRPKASHNARNSRKPAGYGARRSTAWAREADPQRTAIEKEAEEGLQVLFHCEYAILSEYIECMLPLYYAGYLLGLIHLPTAQYYPATRSMTPATMMPKIGQLVLYGSLEFVSFACLQALLKRRLGYSPLYQLAFVLETHAVMIQSALFVWVLFIVPLTLVHLGTVKLLQPWLCLSFILTLFLLLQQQKYHAGVDFNAPFQ